MFFLSGFVIQDDLSQLSYVFFFLLLLFFLSSFVFARKSFYSYAISATEQTHVWTTNWSRETILHDYIYSVLLAPYPTKAIYSDIDHRLCFISQQNQFLSAKDFLCSGEPRCWLILICVYSSYCLLFYFFWILCLPPLPSRLLWGIIKNPLPLDTPQLKSSK